MKAPLIVLTLLVGVLAVGSAECIADEITLALNGKTDYVIVLGGDALPAEKTAASELQKYLEKITGAEYSITDEANAKESSHKIYVGPSKSAQQAVGKLDWEALGTDGIVIKTARGNLILAGGRPRGTIYAVYTFLQDTLGCRWYASDADEVIPSQPTVIIGEQNAVYRPPFDYRLAFTDALTDPLFRVKLRVNGQDWMKEIPEEWGGGVLGSMQNTLLSNVLPVKTYFEEHPDWYAYRISEGKRTTHQICLTNPEARDEAVRVILDYMKENYTNWQYPPKIYSVTLADNDQVCECDECLAIAKREGGYSGPVLDFTNYVAERVGKVYPDVLIHTLAYWNTDRPPKYLKARDNVVIQFAPLDRNQKTPISKVGNFSRYLKDWRSIADHVYIWEYDAHFANFVQPQPNHLVLAESLRFYRDNGMTGVVYQGSWGAAGEFMRMRTWVNSQMMWNPDQDESALADEFLRGYYGSAGPILREYIDLTNRAINRVPDLWLGVYTGDTSYWLTLDDMIEATRLFDQAEAAVAGDETLSYRVRRARLSIDIVWVQRYRELRREAKRQGRTFLGPEDPYAAIDKLAENEFKISTFREWADWNAYIKILRNIMPPRSGNTPVECQGLKPYEWEEVEQDRMTTSDVAIADTIEDQAASNGKALVIEGTDEMAQALWQVPQEDFAGRWRVYVVLRAEPEGEQAALVAGIYVPRENWRTAEICRTAVEFASGDNNYKTIDLGVHNLLPGTKIWVQPNGPGSWGTMKRTHIDRIFLVAAE